MKQIFLILASLAIISCNKKSSTEEHNIESKKTIENMPLTINSNSETLSSNINLDNSLFDKKDIEFKKYKYKNVFIEDIKIKDLLDKNYREAFQNYLENNNDSRDDDHLEDPKPTLFTQLLLIRIQQLEDKNAYFLLQESSKLPGISHGGVELLNQSLWQLFIDKSLFFINESSHYNDIELLDYILKSFAEQYVVESSSEENEISFCNCEGIKKGMLLVNKKHIETNILFKKFQEIFKKETLIEIECAPSLDNGWKSTTKEFYDIKPLIDKEMGKKLGVKEKIFYKVRIVPILKEYYTK
ncbi:hypothetical protein [Flavobacterium daemonense]|uniref:hypothetical protein n=1 Tax=Flavobacterium daemonense TaxID=1393049 RepID=UPI001184BAF4|nr:hypothetical protein [Flavobacterium daemonense]KAF2327714.1 hypothetical protein FND99_18330 [Flavobacterium daemonense]